MAVCRACGAAVGREFRFCPQCAAPVGTEIELVDYGVPVRAEAEVRRGGPDRRWVLGAAALVAVALALWAVSGIGGGGAGRAATTVPPSNAAGSDPGGEAATTVPGSRDGGGAGGATTITGALSPGPSDPQPVFDRPTNLSLLVGSVTSLTSIDLDTGAVTAYRRRGYPVLATGGRLVVDEPGGEVWSVPLVDPGGNGLRIPGSPLLAAASGPVEGQAWLLTGEPPAWRLIDLATGAVVAPPRPGLAPPYLGSLAGPDVSGSRAGGVFARDGDTFRRVFDGALLGSSDRYVAAVTCEQPNRCRLHWLDRSTWAEVSRPVPPDLGLVEGDAGVWLSPDGRFLAYQAETGRIRLFDVAKGATVPVDPLPGSLSASPDGAYLALLDGGSLLVYEADSGLSHPIALDDAAPPRQARTLLVPTPKG